MSLDSQDFEGVIPFMQPLNGLDLPRTGRQLAAQVHAYWASLKGNRSAPLRTELNPCALDAALPWLLVAERIAPGHARLRVAGSALSNLLGMEVRGMPGTIFIEPESRRTFMDTVERVFTTAAVAEVSLISTASYGRPKLGGHLTLWPLASSPETTDRLLGFLYAPGGYGTAPRRFSMGTPCFSTDLRPPVALATSSDAPNEKRPPVRGGHLRVIK
ncbi:MAG: PAS domain-containing protein [Rhodobacteraceae bacterium]|nr:PAS domain-containing protein [Paracoccaceae bacterium]